VYAGRLSLCPCAGVPNKNKKEGKKSKNVLLILYYTFSFERIELNFLDALLGCFIIPDTARSG
jgi:hypothetical protein